MDRTRVVLDDDGSCLDERRCGYDLIQVTKKYCSSSCLGDSSHTHLKVEEEVEGHMILESCSCDQSHQSWNYLHCIRCEVYVD